MRPGRKSSLPPSVISRWGGSTATASFFSSRSLPSEPSFLFGKINTLKVIASSQNFCLVTAGGADPGVGVSGLNRRAKLSLLCSSAALSIFISSLSRLNSSRLIRALLVASTGRSQSLWTAHQICAQDGCWGLSRGLGGGIVVELDVNSWRSVCVIQRLFKHSDSSWWTLKRGYHVGFLMWGVVEMTLWEGWNEKQGALRVHRLCRDTSLPSCGLTQDADSELGAEKDVMS